jgi:hypothetical protein
MSQHLLLALYQDRFRSVFALSLDEEGMKQLSPQNAAKLLLLRA